MAADHAGRGFSRGSDGSLIYTGVESPGREDAMPAKITTTATLLIARVRGIFIIALLHLSFDPFSALCRRA